jgi:hypothetical protein
MCYQQPVLLNLSSDGNEVEGNCEIVELKHMYEIFNVLVEMKCRKL